MYPNKSTSEKVKLKKEKKLQRKNEKINSVLDNTVSDWKHSLLYHLNGSTQPPKAKENFKKIEIKNKNKNENI